MVLQFKSWKVGIQTVTDKNWIFTGLRFPTRSVAEDYVLDLRRRDPRVLAYTIVHAEEHHNTYFPERRKQSIPVEVDQRND